MGHADRSRLHHAFSLDTQSRGVRLSFAGCRHSQSHPNTDINTYRDANSNSHCDGKCYSDTETYPHTENSSNAEAASYAAAPSVARS
jgi:hypothetical protein